MSQTIQKIAVVGAGNMGQQIALSAAIFGFDVKVTDSVPEALEKMRTFISVYLAGRVAKGRMTEEQTKAIAERLKVCETLEETVTDADLVIEAVVELLDVKQQIFRELDRLCPAHTILATNSSYICNSEIACVTNRPEKVCNMHFFNPAIVMKLVEIVRSEKTSQETLDTVYDVCKRMGKEPIIVQKEIPGFIVNNLLDPYLMTAHKLADRGIASPEDIDRAAKYGLGYPMGPFEMNDLTGLDLTYTVFRDRYEKSGDPADLPGILLSKHYYAGEYGRKTGKGFYDYSDPEKNRKK